MRIERVHRIITTAGAESWIRPGARCRLVGRGFSPPALRMWPLGSIGEWFRCGSIADNSRQASLLRSVRCRQTRPSISVRRSRTERRPAEARPTSRATVRAVSELRLADWPPCCMMMGPNGLLRIGHSRRTLRGSVVRGGLWGRSQTRPGVEAIIASERGGDAPIL